MHHVWFIYLCLAERRNWIRLRCLKGIVVEPSGVLWYITQASLSYHVNRLQWEGDVFHACHGQSRSNSLDVEY